MGFLTQQAEAVRIDPLDGDGVARLDAVLGEELTHASPSPASDPQRPTDPERMLGLFHA
jgi:hypothetical protein